MFKEFKGYLHLYTGCQMSTPYGECKFLYFKFHVDERQYNPVVVDRGDNVFAFKLDEVHLLLRPLSDMTEEEMGDIWALIGGEPHLFDKEYFLEWITRGQTESGWEEGLVLGALEMGLITQYLLSNGFDLFGLIEAGGAIDKTKEVSHG